MRRYIRLAFGMLFALSLSANAANIALFSDTNYVDYDPTFTDDGSEASNVQASLEAAGHTVTPFTGTTTAAWSAALAGADVLVIPEEVNNDIAPDLEAGAVTAVQNFVANGGGLLSFEQSYGFLNSVFGYSLSDTGDTAPYNLTAGATGTAFEGGPASLPYNDSTYSNGSLPGSASCMYESGGGNCAVILFHEGTGQIVHLAWDWYNAVPVGTEDSGWIAVLQNAVIQVSVPVPVPTLGEWGRMALVLFFGIAALMMLRRRESATFLS